MGTITGSSSSYTNITAACKKIDLAAKLAAVSRTPQADICRMRSKQYENLLRIAGPYEDGLNRRLLEAAAKDKSFQRWGGGEEGFEAKARMAGYVSQMKVDGPTHIRSRNEQAVVDHLATFVQNGQSVTPAHIKACICVIHDDFVVNDVLLPADFNPDALGDLCPEGVAGWKAYGMLFELIIDIKTDIPMGDLFDPRVRFTESFLKLKREVDLNIVSAAGANRTMDDVLNFVRRGHKWRDAHLLAREKYNNVRFGTAQIYNDQCNALGTVPEANLRGIFKKRKYREYSRERPHKPTNFRPARKSRSGTPYPSSFKHGGTKYKKTPQPRKQKKPHKKQEQARKKSQSRSRSASRSKSRTPARQGSISKPTPARPAKVRRGGRGPMCLRSTY